MKRRLPPQLAAEALARLCRSVHHPRQLGRDPVDHALALRAWIKAARLDRYGWRIALHQDDGLILVIGSRRLPLACTGAHNG